MTKARTPLMQMLQRLFTETYQDPEFRRSRRKFIKQAALGTAAITLGPQLVDAMAPKPKPVVILGAGIAGLHCAWILKKAGIASVIYEGSQRAGGRMYSATNLMGKGITTELGAEFIDSDHDDIRNLCKEFELDLLDMETDKEVQKYVFYYGGKSYSCDDLVKAFAPFAAAFAKDIDSLPEVMRYDDYGDIKPLDQMSITQYLKKKKMSGWLLNLFETAFTTEYGLDASQQSAVNMLFLMDASLPGCSLFGESDERFKVIGGNQRITDELAKKADIRLGHIVTKIQDAGSKRYKVSFANGKTVETAHLVCTLPFSILRNIPLELREMSAVKRKCIRELGYGRNAKTFAGFHKPVWRELGFAGEVFTGQNFQLGWDHSELQGAPSAAYTFFTGGSHTDKMRNRPLKDKVQIYLGELNKVFPGSQKQFNGKMDQFFWPGFKFAKASYACYKVGQWTTIAGAESDPVGNILFAGEHCSYDYQGFMNGGAETGRVAAQKLLAVLK